MLNAKAAVHLMGSPQSGKTSLMHFLKSKILLSSTNSADNWSEVLKKKLTYVRRERHNWLIDL
jgi:ABC-type phosphate/phosphonate transport system ATPase subunit